MHRDIKLGMALAVLLIGTTTAFFFRNDADPDAGLPRLKNPVELDGAIAQRDMAPYPVPDSTAQAMIASASELSWAKPAFLDKSPSIEFIHSPVATPDPIQLELEDDAESLDPTASPLPVPAVAQPATDETGAAVHVVQSGDTLSGLAGRYLGSVARFEEIYELNRDKLSGPHDLKIGMKLRLPTAEPQLAAAETVPDVFRPQSANDAKTAVEPAAESAGETPAVEGSTEKLFVPARKTPFTPTRYRTPSP